MHTNETEVIHISYHVGTWCSFKASISLSVIHILASINNSGKLRYQDVTMGEMVGNYRTGFGHTDVIQVSPYNGIVALGHSLGIISMWKPTSSAPLLKRPCHRGPSRQWHSTRMAILWPELEKRRKLSVGT